MDAKTSFFSRINANLGREERSADGMTTDTPDEDFDFEITESGRTTIGKSAAGVDDDFDGMEFSISNTTGRVNTDRSMNTIGTIGTIDTENSIEPAGSEFMDVTASTRHADAAAEEESDRSDSQPAPHSQTTASPEHSFQPLLPLPEHLERRKSAPRAIPQGQSAQPPQSALGAPLSQPSSAGSSGSAFLNNILNSAATTFNNTHISHTPPTHISTSYEASHFGKRQRSGSISERLRVSSELEEKGMIDREQKGILKDLIISGQDNELQSALDRYEQGDHKMLESMLQSGTLSNRTAAEIDLLGDLDLDFLNVNDTEANAGENIQHMMQPPQPPTTQMKIPAPSGASYEATDGIGELEFGMYSEEYRASSPAYQPQGQRSRSNSTLSLDLNFRQRSNSLFSALIGSVPEQTPPDYGGWMERSSQPAAYPDGIKIKPPSRRSSAPDIVASGLTESLAVKQESKDVPMTAAEKREVRAEQKRREKQEKREQKERERREKREKKEQAKLEKQRRVEMEDKEVHEPGSGRPRSMSDPNLKSSVDTNGLLQVERPEGWIGAYSPESRKVRVARFLEKRNHRVWTKTVKYDVRKNFADSRLRVKGRFVKKEDELLMRELMSLT
mmetsp:Transcript_123897/g.185191  ORF Transcript_123897/g.185191 Transcript_123897/m.185191 type:complete len:617 (+) Transcript_123897:470-2320(+)|eukprot:CAMPEP_0117038928 /NCGR_PEP_ID=MMETSP0472-20121206/27355_1 /TAXON_ID=693140 ORGANISM="Tiarina fusus, Strain LIS" /NCGR_SAMPLE_ID=MMETSP0472 /ASSEMBLY_ACC=CAM_ASM_000603 /LENGTH=616 /DNA_ID=CAMNT_0004749281 /DNA_START=461 /DNA_END=2311 /DNA_ORIENTATION=-